MNATLVTYIKLDYLYQLRFRPLIIDGNSQKIIEITAGYLADDDWKP